MMTTKQTSNTDTRKSFLRQEYTADSAVILRAIDTMSADTRAAFFMYWMDEMNADEIALAMNISERRAAARLRRGQRKVLKALRKTGGETRDLVEADADLIADGTSSDEFPVVTRILRDCVDDLMPEGYAERIVNRAMAAINDIEKDDSEKDDAGKEKPVLTFMPARAVSKTEAKTYADSARIVGRRNIEAPARKRIASAAALIGSQLKFGKAAHSLLFMFKTSTFAQAAAVISVGVLAIGSTVILTYKVDAPPPEDTFTPPAATEPEISGDITRKTETVTESAIIFPESLVEQEVPLAESQAPPEFQPNEAYLAAVEKGVIFLVGDDCACGHVNPREAQATNMDLSKGSLEWTISRIEDSTPLYSGVGGQVTAELETLYTAYGDGSYLIAFTYTTGDGMRVTKSRPIFIDTGTITENQYE